MRAPKRSFENKSEDKIKYFPRRALSVRDQTLTDTTIDIDDDLFDQDLGYFVSCENDIHDIVRQMKVRQ